MVLLKSPNGQLFINLTCHENEYEVIMIGTYTTTPLTIIRGITVTQMQLSRCVS